jgi:hypothetical protein
VFLRSGLLLSRRPYADWREVQDAHDDYLTSLGPWTAEEIADYFAHDYTSDDARWPFSRRQVEAFFASSAETLCQTDAAAPRP